MNLFDKAIMMEHGSGEHIKEKLHMEITIKTEMEEAVPSAAYIDIEIDVKHMKQEPGLVQHVKSEPVWSVKEAILEDNKQGPDEQQEVPVTSTHPVVNRTSVSAETVEREQLIHIKEQLEDTDLDLRPAVLQHINSQYRINQTDLNGIKQKNTVLNLDTEETLSKIEDGQVALNQVRDETIESSRKDNAALVQCDSIANIGGVVQSKIYICDMCKKTFKTRAAIRSHIKCVHGTSQFICPECNKNFRCQQYLTHHIVFVHGPQHNCEICEKIFKCSKLLGDHIKFVHRNKTADSSNDIHTCDYCSEKFESKRKLMSHLQNMHRSKSCRCKACKKSLRRQRFRQRHSDKVDSGETNKHQRYRCDKCLKVYKSKDGLWHHSKRVHGTGSHKCNQCDKEFKCNLYLVRHVRYTHSEEQYECDICKKMCKSKAALSRHVSCFHRRKLAYPKDGDNRCDKCTKAFQSKIALMRHYKYVHGTERYKCEECNKEYKCKAYLTKHLNEAHSNMQFECDICKKIFKTKRALHGHILRLHSCKLPDSQLHLPKTRVYVQRTYTRSSFRKKAVVRNAVVTSTAVGTSAQQHGAVEVKSEPANTDLELGPVVFQHMDSNYRPYKEEPQHV